ncbi:MAG: hypothetical protein ABSD49_13500 [Candidatus Bathyarchaeia archaeon]
MAKKPTVFIREATGLVRGFGGWDSFGFNFGGNVVVVGSVNRHYLLPWAHCLVQIYSSHC